MVDIKKLFSRRTNVTLRVWSYALHAYLRPKEHNARRVSAGRCIHFVIVSCVKCFFRLISRMSIHINISTDYLACSTYITLVSLSSFRNVFSSELKISFARLVEVCRTIYFGVSVSLRCYTQVTIMHFSG